MVPGVEYFCSLREPHLLTVFDISLSLFLCRVSIRAAEGPVLRESVQVRQVPSHAGRDLQVRTLDRATVLCDPKVYEQDVLRPVVLVIKATDPAICILYPYFRLAQHSVPLPVVLPVPE